MKSSELSKKSMLNSLTSFRFIAALMVFIFHAGLFPKYQIGYIGVSFFFILSGFILAYNYMNRFENGLKKEMIEKFYIARIAKIYPIHVLTFLFAVPYYFFITLKHEPILYVFQAFTNIFLVHSFIPFGNISFNGVSWSLSNELFFYAIFPLSMYIFLKCFRSIKLMIASALIIWFVFLILFLSLLPKDNSITTWFAYYFPGMRVLEFFIGMIIGIIFLKKNQMLEVLPKSLFSLLEIVSVVLTVILILVSPKFIQSVRFGLVFIPCLSVLIFVFAFQKGAISDLLSNIVLVYLGKISFSFYMVHNLVLSYIYYLWKPDIPASMLLIICLVLSISISIFLYHSYEEPVRKLIINWHNSKREIIKRVPTSRQQAK